MAEAMAGDVIERNFHHDDRPDGKPFGVLSAPPSARTTGRRAGEARRLNDGPQ